MTLRLNGSTSGYTEIDAPAVAGNNNLKLPTGNGSDGNILGTDGSGNLSWVNGRMVLATAQNSTSGTAIDFTGIPSWVKRVTVMFNGVSTNGTSNIQVQVGSGTLLTSGYNGSVSIVTTSVNSLSFSAGFLLSQQSAASYAYHGSLILVNVSATVWAASSIAGITGIAGTNLGGGSVSLSGTLDRIRITTVNGTDTFDAGSINILYEG